MFGRKHLQAFNQDEQPPQKPQLGRLPGLVWRYGAAASAGPEPQAAAPRHESPLILVPQSEPAAEQAAYPNPGTGHLRDLMDLGDIGYVHGIEAKLSELDREACNAPLVAALRERLEQFDFAGYRTILEEVKPHD